MSTTEQILVVILATGLAVLTVLAIIAVTFIIKLVQSLRRIASSAEGVVQSAESIASAMKRTTTPVGVFSFVKEVVSMVQKAKAKK